MFTFTFNDEAGNTGETTADVSWIDKEVPIITLSGDASITIEYGDAYIEQGATREDNYDGD